MLSKVEIGETYKSASGKEYRVLDISVSIRYDIGIAPIITYQSGDIKSVAHIDLFLNDLNK